MTSAVEDDEPSEHFRPAAREGYDVGRLLAFSDGVFAIAITLLVLSIPVPNVPKGPDQAARLAVALLNLRPQLFGFAVSFILVGAQWTAHHQMLRRLKAADARILWLNLLILLGICLVPFATSLLIDYGNTSTGAIAYGSWQLLIAATFLVMRLYLAAQGAAERRSILVGMVALSGFAVSIPVALWDVEYAYLLWLAGFVAARLIEARARAAAH